MSTIENNRKYIRKCSDYISRDFRDDDELLKLLGDLQKSTMKMIEAEQKVLDQQEAILNAETTVERFRVEQTNSPQPMEVQQLFKIHEEAMKKSMSQLRDERKKKISRHPDVLYIENIVKHKGGDSSRTEENQDDLEMISTPSEMNLLDPITKKTMTEPVRHKKCGHVYDKLSIVKMIKSHHPKGFRCPYMGCASTDLREKNLVVAEDYLAEIERRAAQ